MKPNFLVIGAAKSGTTWLHSCLEQHPQIYVPLVKEIHFFSYPSRYKKGFAWYESFFEECQTEKSIGEVSPSYIVHSKAAERIYNYNPEMRSIVVLRNPIERAYSDYCMLLRSDSVSEDIEQIFSLEDKVHPLVSRGLYYSHIVAYLKFFSLENIKISIYEDLKQNPEGFIEDIYSFLEVEPKFKPSILYTRQNSKQALPKFKRVYLSLKTVQKWITKKSVLGKKSINYLRRYGYFDFFHRINQGKDFPTLSQDKKQQLAKFFQEDVASLSKLIDRDLSFWLEPYL